MWKRYSLSLGSLSNKQIQKAESAFRLVSAGVENKRPIAYTSHNVTRLYYGETDVYICCFCRNSDSLNMWRYYTKDNTGCALGFMEGKLERNTRREQFELR